MLLAQGDLSGANSQFQSSLEIALKLTNQDPSNSLWQRDLGVVYDKLGDVLKAQGDLNGAKTQFQRGLQITQELAKQDPSNSDVQRDLTFPL